MSIFNKKPLNRDNVLGAKDIKIEQVDVPEWGGHVFVKGMTGVARGHMEVAITEGRGEDREVNLSRLRAAIAAVTICNEDGELLFTTEDIAALNEKSAGALQRVFDVSNRLSGTSKDDVKELSEELEKNPSGDSASD